MHWTGAAVLLALAVLGSEGARPRRAQLLSWADFAREHDLDAEPQRGADGPRRLAAVRAHGGRPHGAPARQAS